MKKLMLGVVGLLLSLPLHAQESGSSGTRDPLRFYVGGDFARATLSTSSETAEFGQDNRDIVGFVRGTIGVRLFQKLGFEAQYGRHVETPQDPDDVKVRNYYGFFLVPTGTVLETVEVSTPLGYSKMDLKRGAASGKFDGLSFGLDLALPLRVFWDAFPDLRLYGGGMVYRAAASARIYGFHGGVRWDFEL